MLGKIRTWVNQVLERARGRDLPPFLCLSVWRTNEQMRAFYRREREALGVIAGEETDFLATHEAWRGYPRIHACEERLAGIPDTVVQGAIHHEVGHALHHGAPEYYTFLFSNTLQEAGRASGLDLPLLQLCIYFLSMAVKDREVVQWLAQIGLDSGQRALLQHVLSETEAEHQIWKVVRENVALRKLAFATFLKTLLPIEAMASVGTRKIRDLQGQWNEAYEWLSKEERDDLFRLAHDLMRLRGETFQERLEQAALLLIIEPSRHGRTDPLASETTQDGIRQRGI